ncbi:co-chaperone GroES [candidate division KSB1 bacterium]|nr:co-chaperone GroES [candidate division KSB1 bacterium]
MRIKPLDERVLVRTLEEEEKKVGGIIIPDTAKEKPQIGEVIAMGNDREPKEEEKKKWKKFSKLVKVGDRLIYAKYGGTEVEVEGEKLLILDRSDIHGVVVD